MFRYGALSQIYSGSLGRATIGDMEVSREAVRVCKKIFFLWTYRHQQLNGEIALHYINNA